jgi:hypothetical protein
MALKYSYFIFLIIAAILITLPFGSFIFQYYMVIFFLAEKGLICFFTLGARNMALCVEKPPTPTELSMLHEIIKHERWESCNHL